MPRDHVARHRGAPTETGPRVTLRHAATAVLVLGAAVLVLVLL